MEKAIQFSRSNLLFLSVAVIITLTLLFETSQQLYYITVFQKIDDVSFFELFKNQSYRWLCWALFSVFLVKYGKLFASKKQLNLILASKYVGVIFLLVFANILVIAAIQLLISSEPFTLNLYFSEFLPFFFYQKLPLFTIAYFFMAIAVHFHFINGSLADQLIQVEQEIALVKKNQQSGKPQILKVKIGDTHKLIKVENILWVEADGYCVLIYGENEKAPYTMRTSLLALEKEMGSEFIRVHRKALVNIHKVRAIKKGTYNELILEDGSNVPISKAKLSKILNFFEGSLKG